MKSHRARDTVTLLQNIQVAEMPEFMLPDTCPPNLPDLNPVDYSVRSALQERVYRSQIHDVKELKECLLREWRLVDHSIIVAVTAQWRTR